MLLILKITTERNVTQMDYHKVKRGIEKMGYACFLRTSEQYPTQIIIEGADTSPEIFKILEKECATQ